jgi:[ribosomal protein S5]-alanine N-acetyltransferase
MADPIVEIETDRLRLRRLDLDDAEFVFRLVNEPSWLRFIGDRNVHDLDGARRYITDGPQRLYARYGFGLFLVERRSDLLPLGMCGLIKRDTLPDVDIGFAFLPEHWKHGYAREAAEATLRYARERHRLPRVIGITSLDNVASGQVLERIGLQPEGTVCLAGSAEEVRLFGTTRAYEFDAPNARPVFDNLWTSGQLSARDIERLPEFGIDAVVNLALPSASNALPGEAEAVAGQGMTFVQIPVPWEKPEPRHLQQFIGVMDAFGGRTVWVHCALNFRVSAFVYLYRRLRLGEAHEAALHPLRTVWRPNPVWQAFIEQSLLNPAQGPAAAPKHKPGPIRDGRP